MGYIMKMKNLIKLNKFLHIHQKFVTLFPDLTIYNIVATNCYPIISDTCTELPAAVSDMTTTSTFPVLVGTVVEVNCKPGHTLAGDSSITCIRDVSFNIGQHRTCTIGLKIINSKM